MKFEYKPLLEDYIRLIQIEADPFDNIRLQVQSFPLSAAPSYTALSYTWRGEQQSEPVDASGSLLCITPNLKEFLDEAKKRVLHTKREFDGGWLWVDAVSINQEDDKEKSTQIGMMRAIYEKAATVIAWLGTLEEDKLLLRLRQEQALEDLGTSSLFNETFFQAINRLASTGYWTRLWIIQEITALNPVIYPPGSPTEFRCQWVSQRSFAWFGPLSRGLSDLEPDSYTRMRDIFNKLRHSLPLSRQGPLLAMIDALDILKEISAYSYGVKGDPYFHLFSVLSYTQSVFHAPDPRDKLYGLLSFIQSREKPDLLLPDYPQPAADIYYQFARNIIRRDHNFDVLGFAGVRGDVVVPSWVPDWTAHTAPRSLERRIRKDQRTSKQVYDASSGTKFQGRIDEDQRTLQASGVHFDTIAKVLSTRRVDLVDDSLTIAEWRSSVSKVPYPLPSSITYIEALNCTKFADLNAGKRLYNRQITELAHNNHYFWPDCKKATLERALFFTSKGHMGLGPHTTLVGDEVCLLEGAQVPTILRKGAETWWTFIGEAYVHGIMDGEGWHESRCAFNIKR